MMKFCPVCGTKVVENAKFCFSCGADLEKYKKQIDSNFQNINDSEESILPQKTFLDKTPEELFEEGSQAEKVKDYEKALNYYKASAEMGNADAMFKLSYMYLNGQGIQADESKSLDWVIKAAEAGEYHAMKDLAERYDLGDRGAEKSPQKSFLWYKKAAEAGYEFGMHIVKNCYQKGEGVEENPKAAFDYFLEQAKTGHIEAITVTGELYLEGYGVEQNNEIAFDYFLRAAKAGDRTAMIHVGNSYFEGRGVKQDYASAKKWFEAVIEKSPIKSDDYASNMLGVMYLEGYGVEKNFDIALKYFTDAAERSNPKAKISLGNMYRTGTGVKKNIGKALKYYEDVAEFTALHPKEASDANYFIGEIYNSGDGVTRDKIKAYEHFKTSAETGNFNAMLILPSLMKDNEVFRFSRYNDKEHQYEIQLGSYILTFKKDFLLLIDVNERINSIGTKALNELKNFYVTQGNIDKVAENIYAFGVNLLEEVATIGVDILVSRGKYDVTNKILVSGDPVNISDVFGKGLFLTSPEIPVEIWNDYTERVIGLYQGIQSSAQAQRDYRQYRKETRDRFVGGGFGIGGAVKGMIQAGALNMLTGAAHSIFNAFGNLATDWQESSDKKGLYEDPRVLNTLVAGIVETINAIKYRTFAILGYNDLKDKEEESVKILDNVKRGHLSGENLEKALLNAFLANPFSLEAYRLYLENFGDIAGEVDDFARFCGISNDLSYIKYELLIKNLDRDMQWITTEDIEEHYLKSGIPKLDRLQSDFTKFREIANQLGARHFDNNNLSLVQESLLTFEDFAKAVTAAQEKLDSKLDEKICVKPFKYLCSKIESFVVPEGVEIISSYAFAECRQLRRITLPSTLKKIERGAFYNCRMLYEVDMLEGLEAIEEDAFKNCDELRWIEIPQGVKEISIYLTNYRSKHINDDYKPAPKYICLPDSIENIFGNPTMLDEGIKFVLDVERDTHLSRFFKEHDSLNHVDILTREKFLADIKSKYGVNDPKKKFGDDSKDFDAIVLRKSHEYKTTANILGEGVFENANVDTIFTTSRIIGSRAFANSEVTWIWLHTFLKLNKNFLRVIHDEAFINCRNLEHFHIPIGTKEIGSRVFQGCTNLKAVTIPPTVEFIGEDILKDSPAVVYCSSESFAYDYCKSHSIPTIDKGHELVLQARDKINDKSDPKCEETALNFLYDAMTYGNLEAVFQIAEFNLKGIGTSKSVGTAIEHYTLAAEAGYKDAMKKLTQIYSDGSDGSDGVEKNLVKAQYWRNMLTEKENTLKFLPAESISVEPAPPKKSAEKKSSVPAVKGDMSPNERKALFERSYKDDPDAVEKVLALAENGDIEAMEHAGCIENRRGNKEKGKQWHEKSANAGWYGSMIRIGNQYKYGGSYYSKNEAETFKWYMKAADVNPEGAYYVADAYRYGTGVEKDYAKAIEWYQKAIQAGSASAVVSLGDMHYEGEGFDKDASKALELYLQADKLYDKKGEPYADLKVKIAGMYRRGDGTTKNLQRAEGFYRQALEIYKKSSDNDSLFQIGLMYYYGYGVEENYAEAVAWFQKATDADHYEAKNFLKAENGDLAKIERLIMYHGDGSQEYWGIEKNSDKVEYWRKRAIEARLKIAETETDNGENFFKIGQMYYDGHGVKKNYTEAIVWFQKAVDAGNFDANEFFFKIGLMYYHGDGAEKNYTEAINLFQKAADAGNYEAETILKAENGDIDEMETLGQWYSKGYYDIKKDPDRAKYWLKRATEAESKISDAERMYRAFKAELQKKDGNSELALEYLKKSAEAGWLDAMTELANYYSIGLWGLPEDKAEAFKWYMKVAAVDENHKTHLGRYVSYEIGQAYYFGWGVEKDYSKAVEWYQKAAQAGDPSALESLGDMYYKGEEIRRDVAKALDLYLQADKINNKNYKKDLKNAADLKFKIAGMYHRGDGTPVDFSMSEKFYKQAFDLYRRYVESVNSDSYYDNHSKAECFLNMGLIYYNGYSGEENHTESISLFQKATDANNYKAEKILETISKAENGDIDAMKTLSRWYQEGIKAYDWCGIEKDSDKAEYWSKKVAEIRHKETESLPTAPWMKTTATIPAPDSEVSEPPTAPWMKTTSTSDTDSAFGNRRSQNKKVFIVSFILIAVAGLIMMLVSYRDPTPSTPSTVDQFVKRYNTEIKRTAGAVVKNKYNGISYLVENCTLGKLYYTDRGKTQGLFSGKVFFYGWDKTLLRRYTDNSENQAIPLSVQFHFNSDAPVDAVFAIIEASIAAAGDDEEKVAKILGILNGNHYSIPYGYQSEITFNDKKYLIHSYEGYIYFLIKIPTR